MPLILYPSVFNAPGAFTTTNDAPKGWETVAPPKTPRPKPQQPPGLSLPDGAFTTNNSVPPGWDTFAPASLPRRKPQQPPGLTLPPGVFAGVTPVAVVFGWQTIAPQTTRRTNDARLRQQPGGWNPVNPTPPSTNASARSAIVPRVPIRLSRSDDKEPKKIDPRSVRFTETVEQILNGLIREGQLVQTDNANWRIALIPRTCAPGSAFKGEIFINNATEHLCWVNPGGSIIVLA